MVASAALPPSVSDSVYLVEQLFLKRLEGLHEYLHHAAANMAAVFGFLLGEVEAELFGFTRIEDAHGGFPHLGLEATAPDGAFRAAVLTHEHFRIAAHGRGALSGNDGGERAALAVVLEFRHFPENVLAHSLLRLHGIACCLCIRYAIRMHNFTFVVHARCEEDAVRRTMRLSGRLPI